MIVRRHRTATRRVGRRAGRSTSRVGRPIGWPTGWPWNGPSAEARLAAATERAFATVPFYREAFVAAAGSPGELPIVRTEDLERLGHLLDPIDAAPEAGGGDRDLDRLAAALRLGGTEPDGRPLVELRDALVDPGVCGRSPYRVLLAPDRGHAPGIARLREAAEHLLASPEPAILLGEVGRRTDTERRLGGFGPRVATIDLRAVTTLGDPVVSDGAIVTEPRLGPVAALVPRCRRWHLLDPIRVADGPEGIEFADVERRHPTLLRYLPDGASSARVGRCPIHRSTVLEAA